MTSNTKARAQSAWWRAFRTFLVTFIGFLLLHFTDIWTVAVWKAAATAGFFAFLTVVLRLLDYTSVPTPPSG